MRTAANACPRGPPCAALLAQTLRTCVLRPSRTQRQRSLAPLSTAFMREEAEDCVCAYYAVLNSGNFASLHRLLSPAVTYSDRVWASKSLRGLESVSRVLREAMAGYPDITYRVDSVMCDRVHAAAHWTCTATNFGSVAGAAPASGRRSEFSGVTLFAFGGDGKIEDVVVYRQGTEDERAFMRLCDLEGDS